MYNKGQIDFCFKQNAWDLLYDRVKGSVSNQISELISDNDSLSDYIDDLIWWQDYCV